jgi:hypothetical protein
MQTPPLGEVKQLASALQGLSSDTSNFVTQRKAEIVSVESGTPDTCTIMLSGDTTEIPGVYFLNSYVPTVGDIVVINKQGGSLLITGTFGDVTPAADTRIQDGSTLVSFTSLGSYTEAIVFPTAYAGGVVPTVFTGIASGAGVTARWHSRAFNVTNTGFTLFLFKGDLADANQTWASQLVQWMSFAP